MNEIPHPGFDKPEEYETFTTTNGLEEAAEEYEKKHTYQLYDGGGLTPEYNATLAEAFKAGAEWQKAQMMDEWLKDRDGCFWDGVAEGKKAMKEQMLNEAVEGDIGMTLHDKRADLYVRSKGYLPESLGIKCNDKVRIIIVKEDEL